MTGTVYNHKKKLTKTQFKEAEKNKDTGSDVVVN